MSFKFPKVAEGNNYMKVTFVLILLYVSFINLFVLRSTPEIMALEFGILVLIFYKIRFKEFAKFWVPFLGLFFLYEFLRGYVDDLSPFYNTMLFKVYELELLIFKTLPTKHLQSMIPVESLFTNFTIIFYTSFFYYSFLVAFILWFKKAPYFEKYVKGFLLLSFLGLFLFFLIPTAPPWFVQERFDIGIERYFYQETVLNHLGAVTIWNYFIYGNPVAAMPSLHTAWPAFTTHFLLRYSRKKWQYGLLVIPAMIAFSVVLTGEHYVLDIVAGWLLAFFSIWIVEKMSKRKNAE